MPGRNRRVILRPYRPAHMPRSIEHRQHTAIRSSARVRSRDTRLLLASASRIASPALPILRRQTKPQRAVGIAKPEVLDRRGDPALLKISQRLGRSLQALMVVVDHLREQRLRRPRRLIPAASSTRTVEYVVPTLAAKEGMPSRSSSTACRNEMPFAFITQSTGPPASLAAEAVPQVLRRRHHERGRLVLVERAVAAPVLARFRKLDAVRSTSCSTDTSAFKRSSSDSAIRAINPSFQLKPVKKLYVYYFSS